MNKVIKPTSLYWLISIIALLWNCIGVVAYLSQAYMTDEAIKILPEENQLYFSNVPAWVTAAFAVAVFSGTIGAVLMLLKKKIATTFFILSFIGIISQMSYGLLINENTDSYGPMGLLMPLMIISIGGYLIWYSKKAAEYTWLS